MGEEREVRVVEIGKGNGNTQKGNVGEGKNQRRGDH